MKRKILNIIAELFGSILWIYLGITLIISNDKFMRDLYLVTFFAVLVYSIIKIINVFANKKKKEYFRTITRAILNTILGIFLCFHINYFVKGIILIYILYLLMLTITESINSYIYYTKHIKGVIKPISNAIFNNIMVIIMIFNQDNVKIASLIFGIYFIIYGAFEFLNMIVELLPQKIQEEIRIALPSVVAMFIPKILIQKIDDDMVNNKFEKTKYQKKPGHANLFVIIHLAKSGSAAYGHIEIALGNKIYSYGNYNNHSSRIYGALGDGMLMICDRQKYMRQEVIMNKRYLFEFGLHVAPIEMIKIKKKLKGIFKDSNRWYSDIERKAMGDKSITKYDDASSNMHRYADAEFYKVTKGKHQKFFILQSNCTMMPEAVLDVIGLHIHSMNGILAPGNYFDYLNSEYNRDNSKFISKRVYTKEDFN